MLDIIGKRRYGYVLSAIAVTLGLLFILATLIPNGNVGLQFSIAYTGGTVWEVHFEDGTPDPVEVRAVLEEQGLPGSEVAITGSGEREYVLIRTQALTLIDPEVTEGSAAAALAAEQADGSPAATLDPASTAGATESEAPSESAAPTATDVAAESEVPAQSSAPLDAETAEPSTVPAEASAVDDPVATTTEPTAAPATSQAPDSTASPEAGEAAAATTGSDDGPVSGVPTEGQFGELATVLQERFGRIDEVRQQDSVGAVVSAELIQQTFLLIVIAGGAIMAWVTFRFRDFRMGVTAIVALLHDVVITVGVFAVLGTFIGLQIDALFVTAMLTVIGFSVHDTIVVFDRIRENRQRFLGEPLELIVNHSLAQTLGRSVTTSLTLVVTLVALLLFGGEAIRPFTVALLVGVVAGTYSSIFVATPLFLDWHLFDDRRKASRPVERKSKAKASAA